MFLILALSCLFLHTVGSRLDCLQYELGKEKSNTQWTWQNITDTSSNNSDRVGWMYHNSKCPLQLFSEQEFCINAVGCGKKMLFVGDSTVQRTVNSLPLLMNITMQRKKCPTMNGCHTHSPTSVSRTHHGCVNGGHVELMLNTSICDHVCPANETVLITYIRHDYIQGVHGLDYYKTSLCEHWQAIAHLYDYLFVSIGPHANAMTQFPYGKPVAQYTDFRHKSFFAAEAIETANVLNLESKPNAQLIFRTGPVGVAEYSKHCELQPFDTPPVIHNNHSWPLIPVLNDIYVNTLRNALGQRLLIMDTSTLMSKMRGCRRDPMHLRDDNASTPILLEWLILQNLLVERHRIDSEANNTLHD